MDPTFVSSSTRRPRRGGGLLWAGALVAPGATLAQDAIPLEAYEDPAVGIVTVLVMIFIGVNLIVDLLYGVLDPRIRRG